MGRMSHAKAISEINKKKIAAELAQNKANDNPDSLTYKPNYGNLHLNPKFMSSLQKMENYHINKEYGDSFRVGGYDKSQENDYKRFMGKSGIRNPADIGFLTKYYNDGKSLKNYSKEELASLHQSQIKQMRLQRAANYGRKVAGSGKFDLGNRGSLVVDGKEIAKGGAWWEGPDGNAFMNKMSNKDMVKKYFKNTGDETISQRMLKLFANGQSRDSDFVSWFRKHNEIKEAFYNADKSTKITIKQEMDKHIKGAKELWGDSFPSEQQKNAARMALSQDEAYYTYNETDAFGYGSQPFGQQVGTQLMGFTRDSMLGSPFLRGALTGVKHGAPGVYNTVSKWPLLAKVGGTISAAMPFYTGYLDLLDQNVDVNKGMKDEVSVKQSATKARDIWPQIGSLIIDSVGKDSDVVRAIESKTNIPEKAITDDYTRVDWDGKGTKFESKEEADALWRLKKQQENR